MSINKKLNTEIARINKILRNHDGRIAGIEEMLARKPRLAVKKRLSVNEVLAEKNAKTDVDKTLVIGYFLEKYEGVSPFNRKDLANTFRDAREPLPSNLSQMVNTNIEKGYMMQTKEKKDNLKAFMLTNSGMKLVVRGLSRAKR